MPYNGQIIHFSGGINEYIGELDQAPHKMGKNWYRINNPCMIREVQTQQGMQTRLMAIQGVGNFYKRFVDIRVPDDSIVEIRVVDKEGDLVEAYRKESVREKSKIIQMASNLKLN